MPSDLDVFLNDRVTPIRGLHHVNYRLDADVPSTAVAMACAETGMVIYLLPVIGDTFILIEAHGFVDGDRHPINASTTRVIADIGITRE